MPANLVSSGFRTYGESGMDWWLVDGEVSDVLDFMELHHISAHYGGPGQPYARKPVVRWSKRRARALITQSHGVDC